VEGEPSPPSGGEVNVLAEQEAGSFDTVVLESASRSPRLGSHASIKTMPS